MTWLFPLLVVLFAIVSLAMVLIILVQRPQGGGLASAFGGGGNQDTAFGGRTGDALTIATVSTFVLWLLVAIGLNVTDGMTVAAPPAETPVAEAAPMDAPAAGTETSTAPPSIQIEPLPSAPAGVISSDNPVIQPGLEGKPSETPPPPPEPAPAANP
jgi:preprotein translocase subunit SecG